MKVAILQNTIYPYRVPLFRGIAEIEGLELTVFFTDEKLVGVTFPFKTQLAKEKGKYGFYLQPTLAADLEGVDVVLVMFNLRYLSMVKLLFNKALRKHTKILLWGHGFGKNSILNPVRSWMIKKSEGLLLYYEEQQQAFIDAGVDKSLLFYANNTIDVTNFGYNRTTPRNSLLFVGRLQERKKVAMIIEAMEGLLVEFPELQLEIVGDGVYREVLENSVRKSGLDKNVTFHGKVVEENALKEIFDRSLAYVSPGAVGLGVLHAFAYGCPVVTSANDPEHGPEFINLKDGENALLTDGTQENLNTVLHRVATNAPEMEQLRRASAQFYKDNCAMGVMVDKVVEALRTVSKK